MGISVGWLLLTSFFALQESISNEANTYLNSSIEYTCNKSFKLEPSDITLHGRTLNLDKTR